MTIIVIVISWLLPQLQQHRGRSQPAGVEFEVGRLRRQHGQEVSGWVPPPGLVTSPWLPPSVQRDKHLPAAVLPAEGGVSVVAVLLYTLLELAARVILHLRSEEGAQAEVNAGRQRLVCLAAGLTGPCDSSIQLHTALKCVVAVKYTPGVCTWLLQFYEFCCTNKVKTVQHTTKTHGDRWEVNIRREEVNGPLSSHQCNRHKQDNRSIAPEIWGGVMPAPTAPWMSQDGTFHSWTFFLYQMYL